MPAMLIVFTSLIAIYVYYRSWKEAKSDDVVTDEQRSIEDILQGLVHDAIHASDKNYFRGIRGRLQYIYI